VPTYEYQCDKCSRVFEVRQRISEPPLTTHEACGGAVRRLLSAAPFILKGEGWYVTDYPSEARKKAREAEKPPTGGGDGKSAEKAEKKDAKADTPATTTAPAAAPTTAPPSSSPAD
jgi:putative FmdB family regulatory protein